MTLSTLYGVAHTTAYTYDKYNRTTAITYNGDTNKVSYTYDALGRVKTRTATVGSNGYATTYNFVAGNASLYGTNATTPLVSSIVQTGMNFNYAYDSRGNIISETRNGKATTYAYDALGQLIRVNDPHDLTAGTNGTTWVYNYDRGGNITSKVKYAYAVGALGTALGTISYTYDTVWKDKLKYYNGVEIRYDDIGNPLSDGERTYVWGAGRQLRRVTMSAGTSRVIDFAYDHNGLRTRKTVTENGVATVYDYTLHGKLITHMTKKMGGVLKDTLHFFYDKDSRPTFVKWNNVMYRYAHNLQGDIVGILDANSNLVVEYKYDAWGKPAKTTGSMASVLGTLNPFRYRGYIYDEETSLYYLRSRYYNSDCTRFINADTDLGRFPSLQTHNLYEYCYCDPIGYNDERGYSPTDAYVFYQNAAASDGPGIIGDVVGIAGALGILLWGWISGTGSNSASTTRSKSNPTSTPSPSPTVTAAPTPAPTSSRHQEFFPENPLLFRPFGLVMNAYPINATEHKVIKWSIPGSKTSLFEWNLDYVSGAHYHVMLPWMNNAHLEGGHYKPGDMVPEPWNSLFFGNVSGTPWENMY